MLQLHHNSFEDRDNTDGYLTELCAETENRAPLKYQSQSKWQCSKHNKTYTLCWKLLFNVCHIITMHGWPLLSIHCLFIGHSLYTERAKYVIREQKGVICVCWNCLGLKQTFLVMKIEFWCSFKTLVMMNLFILFNVSWVNIIFQVLPTFDIPVGAYCITYFNSFEQ